MKDKIIEILVDNFGRVYCDNCKFLEARNCDDCHRKAMGWGLSVEGAEKIARKILEVKP